MCLFRNRRLSQGQSGESDLGFYPSKMERSHGRVWGRGNGFIYIFRESLSALGTLRILGRLQGLDQLGYK
jgi:hypothetical protein